MRAAILAVSAMIGLTACNKEAKRDANDASAEAQEEARQTNRDIKEGTAKATDEAHQAGRDAQQAGHDAKTGAANEADQVGRKAESSARDQGAREVTGAVVDSIRGEIRQTSRDIKEGTQAATAKVGEEYRQTTRDIGEAIGLDKSTTDADKALTARIRKALKADKDVASEAGDIRIITDKGEVKLLGTVTSKDVKSEISRIAKDVAGMTKVNDEMKVAERVGTGAND
ncbi:MAG: BON domain-containing protein [Fibrobacterota bacterium]|nr:BON domain-containing protein [Fibrobacterota bacterium]